MRGLGDLVGASGFFLGFGGGSSRGSRAALLRLNLLCEDLMTPLTPWSDLRFLCFFFVCSVAPAAGSSSRCLRLRLVPLLPELELELAAGEVRSSALPMTQMQCRWFFWFWFFFSFSNWRGSVNWVDVILCGVSMNPEVFQ